jgi:hypothetical protein
LAGLGIAAAATGDPEMPPEKRAAIAAAKPPTDADVAQLEQRFRAPTPTDKRMNVTTGSADDVGAVRVAAPSLLEHDYALLALPDAQDARLTSLGSTGLLVRLRDSIANTWASSVVTDRTANVLANLKIEAADPAIETFDDVRLNVNEWNVIDADGNVATATFNGSFQHHSTRTKEWSSEPASQWTVTLVRDKANGWLLSKIDCQPIEQG